MDEEGYPLARNGAQSIPVPEEDQLVYNIYYNNHNNNYNYNANNYNNNNNNNATFSGCVNFIDEESGEATGREVVVLRTAPCKDSDDNLSLAELSFLQYSHALLHSHILQRSSLIRKTLHLERNPLTKRYECFASNQDTEVQQQQPYNIIPDAHVDDTPAVPRGRKTIRTVFRVPSPPPRPLPCPEFKQSRSKSSNEVIISIRAEYFHGSHVYEEARRDQTIPPSPLLQSVIGDWVDVIPRFVIWVMRLLGFLLQVTVPWLGLQLAYTHLYYRHIKIHLEGDRRGLDPVFVGSALQGPMFYKIRHFSCPYCRYSREKRVVLRYMDRLRQENMNCDVR